VHFPVTLGCAYGQVIANPIGLQFILRVPMAALASNCSHLVLELPYDRRVGRFSFSERTSFQALATRFHEILPFDTLKANASLLGPSQMVGLSALVPTKLIESSLLLGILD
jgi:hypothetical protein